MDIFDNISHNSLPLQLHHHLLRAYNAQPGTTTELYVNQRFSSVMISRLSSVLLIEIELPTLNPLTYKVYKIYSIPTPQSNEKSASIKLNYNYIMTNQGEHSLIHPDQLTECSTNMKRFVCFRGFATTQGHDCESKMLMEPSNSSASLCDVALRESPGPHWTFLTHSNLWLFLITIPTVLHVQCHGDTETILLPKYGLLSLRPGCSAISEDTRLTSTSTSKFNDIFIYAPNFNLTVNVDSQDNAVLVFIYKLPTTEILLASVFLTYVNCIALIIVCILYCVTKRKLPVSTTIPTTITQDPEIPTYLPEEPYYDTPRSYFPLLRNQTFPTYANA